MTRVPCTTGEIYHVYNRGVDRRTTYLSAADYTYFIHLMYEFNDLHTRYNVRRDFVRGTQHSLPQNQSINLMDGGLTSIHNVQQEKRECLVDIFAFVLMPNHFHFLLRQRIEGGIALFMQRIGTGYTNYFNILHERTGALFEGTYKRVHVADDQYMRYLPHYIHANPLPLFGATSQNVLDLLRSYKWSSAPDYLGTRNFPSVIQKDLLLHMYDGQRTYTESLLRHIEGVANIWSPEKQMLFDLDDVFAHTQPEHPKDGGLTSIHH